MDDNRITYFAETDARNRKIKFGIKAKDRTRHVYVIGKTGMGKSTLLENMAAQDIIGGEGMCFIDPHGKTADLLLEYVPQERIKDVIYIAPFDTEYPISFNVLESVDASKRHLVASGLMSTFKKIWEDAWSARMEYILTNTLLALLEAPNTTLLGVNRMLSDKEYRKEIISHVTDPSVRAFWVNEFANYTERMAAEAVPAIQNKVGQFTANPLIRNMIGQPTSSFDFREAMDRRKIIIINLSKGRIGDENMKLLGGLLVTKIYLAAMSRADVPDRVAKLLPNFYLFVDEFQNFANASFADILSEARKYKLNLTIAHQYIEQMDEIVRPAVFGNVGTMIAFRVGATDAEVLEKEFAPVFVLEDLVNLGFAQIYLKLMIDGLSSQPFSATTLPPIPHPEISFVKDIIDSSRAQYSRPKADVEKIIVEFHDASTKPKDRMKSGDKPISNGQNNSQNKPYSEKSPREDKTKVTDESKDSNSKKEIDLPKPIDSDHLLTKSQDKTQNVQTNNLQNNRPNNSMSSFSSNSRSQDTRQSIAHVSLSQLNKKPKIDHKVQSQGNVNALKDALSKVLAKAKENQSSNFEQNKNQDKAGDSPNSQDSHIQNPNLPKSIQENIEQKPITNEIQVPVKPVANVPQNTNIKEVPEDVLKKVLNG